jgi:plastocyanin
MIIKKKRGRKSMQRQGKAMKQKTERMSRREFLRNTGLIVGGAAVCSMALINACQGTTKTVTQNNVATITMPGATMTAVISDTVVKTVTVTNPPVTIAPDVAGALPLAQTVVPTGAVYNITAQNRTFDNKLITVLAGDTVTIILNNKDAGMVHNFSVYTDSTADTPIFIGPPVTGPGTVSYKVTAPPNADTYYFQCDTHPKTMFGYFVVWEPC